MGSNVVVTIAVSIYYTYSMELDQRKQNRHNRHNRNNHYIIYGFWWHYTMPRYLKVARQLIASVILFVNISKFQSEN
jgi:hypothetical protein